LKVPVSRIATSLQYVLPPFVGVADVLGMLGLILPGGAATSIIAVLLIIVLGSVMLCEELYQRDDSVRSVSWW